MAFDKGNVKGGLYIEVVCIAVEMIPRDSDVI